MIPAKIPRNQALQHKNPRAITTRKPIILHVLLLTSLLPLPLSLTNSKHFTLSLSFSHLPALIYFSLAHSLLLTFTADIDQLRLLVEVMQLLHYIASERVWERVSFVYLLKDHEKTCLVHTQKVRVSDNLVSVQRRIGVTLIIKLWLFSVIRWDI